MELSELKNLINDASKISVGVLEMTYAEITEAQNKGTLPEHLAEGVWVSAHDKAMGLLVSAYINQSKGQSRGGGGNYDKPKAKLRVIVHDGQWTTRNNTQGLKSAGFRYDGQNKVDTAKDTWYRYFTSKDMWVKAQSDSADLFANLRVTVEDL